MKRTRRLRSTSQSAARLIVLGLLLGGGIGACAESTDSSSPGNGTDAGATTAALAIEGVDEGALVSGNIEPVAKVTGARSVQSVAFYLNDVSVDTVAHAPFASTIDTSIFPDGAAKLRAVATIEGGKTVEGSVSFALDNSGPVIKLVSPTSSALFYDEQPLSLAFSIKDSSEVGDVRVSANGIPLSMDASTFIAELALADLALTPEDLPIDLLIRVDATDALNQSSSETFPMQLRNRLAWSYSTLGEIWAPPAFGSEGTSYLGSRDQKLHAVDSAGNGLWTLDTGAEIVLSPAVEYSTGDPRIWVASGNRVLVVDAAGAIVGTAYDAAQTLGTAVVTSSTTAYVGHFGGQLVAMDVATLATKWSFSTGGPVQSAPVVLDGDLVVFGSDDRFVYGVDDTGQQAWKFETGGEVWSAASRTQDGDALIGSHDGYLYRLDPSGTMSWEFDARGQIWGGATEGPSGAIYVGSTFRRLYGLTTKGIEQWQVTVSGLAYATPAVAADGTVYIAATDGVVYALAPGGDVRWQYSTGAEILGSPRLTPDESLLVVGTNDRHLYALYTGAVSCPPPLMVNVWGELMMQYEASRPDATSKSTGTASDAACSRPGVLPWTQATWSEAASACQKVGLFLCPGDLWKAVCEGVGGAEFPYGDTYDGAMCNGNDNPIGGCSSGSCSPWPTGSSQGCVSSTGAFDMSGNVREWTSDTVSGGALVRGGGFRESDDELRCSNVDPATHVEAMSTAADDLGFRCCAVPPVWP